MYEPSASARVERSFKGSVEVYLSAAPGNGRSCAFKWSKSTGLAMNSQAQRLARLVAAVVIPIGLLLRRIRIDWHDASSVITASRQGQELVVEWSCNYRSRVVETASLSLIDCDSSIAVSLAQRLDTRGRRNFPIPNTPMARAFVRVESGERRLYTDCEPLCIA